MRRLLLMVWLCTVVAAQAQTAWPDHIGSLNPEVSNSAAPAEWPADVAVERVDAYLRDTFGP